jgi:hypothetical protein
MALLMETLANKFGPFGMVSVSNSEVGSNRKSRDNEDSKNVSNKEIEKEKPSSSVNFFTISI